MTERSAYDGIKVVIPEEIEMGDLKLLPEDTFHATLQDLYPGMSRASNQPKLTGKWVITSEYEGEWPFEITEKDPRFSTIGENVLETFSLQPQALFNLNGFYEEATGEQLPHGDFTLQEFCDLIKPNLVGRQALLDVIISNESGDERSTVNKRVLA